MMMPNEFYMQDGFGNWNDETMQPVTGGPVTTGPATSGGNIVANSGKKSDAFMWIAIAVVVALIVFKR